MQPRFSRSVILLGALSLSLATFVGCSETATYEKPPEANKEAMTKVDEALKSQAGAKAAQAGAIPRSIKGRAAAAGGAVAPGGAPQPK
jgi:hypothetical protein